MKNKQKKIIEIDFNVHDIVFFGIMGACACGEIIGFSISIDQNEDETCTAAVRVIIPGPGMTAGSATSIEVGSLYSTPKEVYDNLHENFIELCEKKGIEIKDENTSVNQTE